jgi:hypothetical protein
MTHPPFVRPALAVLVPLAAALAAGCDDGVYGVEPPARIEDPPAQSGQPGVAAGPLQFRAAARLGAAGVEARAVVRNAGTAPETLEFGVCNVTLLAHRTADRAGPPAWTSTAARPWEGTFGRGCPLPLYSARLAPGDTLAEPFGYSTPLIELLGDSLPDGRYWFTARVHLVTPRLAQDVDAGALDLALARPALPAERTYDYVTYRAASVPTAAGARVTVTATLTHAGGSLLTYPADCVVRVLAFRDRARRDAAPRSGAADWRQTTQGCAAGTTPLVLSRGESRTFAADAALPAGRHYLAALVRAAGRDLYLSAGEVDVAR